MEFTEERRLQIAAHGAATAKSLVVRRFTEEDIKRGTFSYTGLIGREPAQTLCFGYLDGQAIGAGTVEHNQHDPISTTADERGILLVSIRKDPSSGAIRPIETLVPTRMAVPGTTRVEITKIKKTLGTAVWVRDEYPARLARQLIFQQAWPLRGTGLGVAPGENAFAGFLVEWRWLELEAKKSVPVFGAPELHAELLTRSDVREALGLDKKAPKEATR